MKNFLIFSILCAFSNLLISQNLVINGSFENHKDIQCLSCYDKDVFKSKLQGWTYKNWLSPYVCNKKYGFYEHGICDLSQYSPKDSSTSIELILFNGYTHNVTKIGGCETEGYANYLETELIKNLEKDKIYCIHISFNIFKKPSNPLSPDYAHYIGIDLTTQPMEQPFRAYGCTRYSNTPFLLDTLITDTWIDKVWYIRPTTALKYIQIGVFYNENWLSNITKVRRNGRYAVDNVSITEITDTLSVKNEKVIAYPFLNSTRKNIAVKPTQPLEINEIFYFDLNKSELTPSITQHLDSLYLKLKNDKFQTVLDIVGHTDSTGTAEENKTLSMKRAQVIYEYLLQKGIPFYCMNILYKAAQEPLSSNDTEGGRKLNRRTEIITSEWRLSEQFYYYASRYAESGQKDSAFIFLNRWLKNEKTKNKTLIFLDPDLAVLKSDNRWKALYSEIKEEFKQFKKPYYAFVLDSLYNADQLYRTVNFEDYKKYDPKYFDTLSQTTATILIKKQDTYLISILKNWVKKYGYPKISEVGKKSAKAAFYIYDHANTNDMIEYLPHLQELCKANEAEWDWYATVYDRVQLNTGKPQRYGTQYNQDPKNPKRYVIDNLENKEKLNEYRKSVNLPPLNEKDMEVRLK